MGGIGYTAAIDGWLVAGAGAFERGTVHPLQSTPAYCTVLIRGVPSTRGTNVGPTANVHDGHRRCNAATTGARMPLFVCLRTSLSIKMGKDSNAAAFQSSNVTSNKWWSLIKVATLRMGDVVHTNSERTSAKRSG